MASGNIDAAAALGGGTDPPPGASAEATAEDVGIASDVDLDVRAQMVNFQSLVSVLVQRADRHVLERARRV